MKQRVVEFINEYKIIAITRGIYENIIPAAEALYEGGIRLLEVAFPQRECLQGKNPALDIIKMLNKHFNGRMIIGAGTVMTPDQAESARDAGAEYIISPNTNASVIKKTISLGLVSMPGAFTPTEIAYAYESGADYVKLFPAGDLGIGYIKSVSAPLDYIPLIAVGGVNESNMEDFLKAGVKGFGIGSSLVKPLMVEKGIYNELTANALMYTSAISKE